MSLLVSVGELVSTYNSSIIDHRQFVRCNRNFLKVILVLTWESVADHLTTIGILSCSGANDVANAFGTSVGSKTLTLRQAVIVSSTTS